MWIHWLKCFLVVIFGVLETNSGGDPFSQQPRIVIEDGHLVIRSALNRNVSLSSTGQGAVQINNVDMGKMASSGQAAGSLEGATMTSQIRRMNQLLGQSISDLGTKVNQLEENITDIAQRMNQFVGSDQSQITNRGMRRYFAKMKALEDKVNHLTELLSTNECASNPCRNGGKCVDSYNGFVCNCPANWEGPHCDNDVNECALYAGTAFGCQNGATCMNLQGSYRCDCPTNWFGIHCTQQHDDCSSASHQELCGQGTCVDEKRVQPGQPKYRCICNPGWTTASGSPACTQDIDECQEHMAKCSKSPLVQCYNIPGSFYCGPCPTGYTGNGQWCGDINECENQNGGCSRSPYVECYNTPGSRRCGPCPIGYFGNGEYCTFQGVCSNNRGGCHPLATCHENPAITGTLRECRCPPGYVGSGEGLTGCVQGQGMSCANNPCQHGTCEMVGQSYHCVCQAGYFGTHCEIAEDPCFSAPCQNGGTCVRSGATFSCNCPEGYSGPTCVEQRNECGGYLNGNNGTLHYPEYNTHYDHGENCVWLISVDPEKVVNVTFDHFALEHGYNCEFDFLQLNDGPNAGSWVVGRFCSDQLHGETFTTTHNQIYLWFHSDRSISQTGFTITWKAVDPICGGLLNVSDYGSVRSPGYPGRYPVNRTCSWLVQVPFGKKIQFSFATLMLEVHPNCSYDYLKIFDGASETDPLLGNYCSTDTPGPLITSGHTATLLFHSDHSHQDNGFNIAYTSLPKVQGCGGTITEPQGTVTSPEYPNVYQHNLLCEWLIRIHPDNRLKITFTTFHLEHATNCTYDYLEIYDGSSDAAPLFGRYCGTNIPLDILSNSNQVYIRFKTDFSMNHPGFSLDYRTICGGVYTALSGIMTSPYYSDPYPMNSICLYEVRLPAGYLVNLTIYGIDIEPHQDCKYDYLEIRDGNSETSPVSALLCGKTASESIVSTYNHLWMKFQTDGSLQYTGFSAQYEAIEIGCGGVMINNNGQISSPPHPQGYPHSTTCMWLIRAPQGHVIRLSFSTFLLELSEHCSYDYLLIEDINGVEIGKYCGTTKPPIITSLDNTLLLKFVTDSSVAGDGFIADYSFYDASESCGGTYYQESGVIRSPGYPVRYPHSIHCVWILQAPNNRQITLTVNNFTTEFHTECKYDYLEIRNGGYEMSPVIGKYCGNTIMTTIRSHSNMMRLEFKTDSWMSAPGFEINFDSSTVGCGGMLTTTRGSIVSPNYPLPYPYNAECLWLIRISEGSTISLTIVDMDIEEHETCIHDYLEIFDGDSENSKSLTRLCNNQQHPGDIKSTGNAMLLRFRSDFSDAAGGFHAVYQTSCKNILTKRRGVIESPNFPNSYPHNHNCSWMIQAPPGNNISISFSHIFIEATDNCTLDYVEVLENKPSGSVSLGKFCGDMSRPPQTIETSTNTASIKLITDKSISREGFRLEWTIIGCGGDISNRPYGYITSPNYPNGYRVDTTCNWHIWYPPGSRVEFTIEHLDLERHNECDYDFVKVYGGEDTNAPLLRTVCNSAQSYEVLTSHGNQIYVQFHSDVSIVHGGFRASFKKLENGCGGRLTGQEANFLSPNHPDPYQENDECDWLIEVSSSNLVMLEFYEFDMPQAANCTHGYVAVYDGNNSSAPLLMKNCGSKPEGFISSTGNQMLVRLVADGVNVAKGFRAHYKQGCGRRLLADEGGEIQSPNYPDDNAGFANCSWILYASDFGEKVSLTITHLFIPEFDNCTMSLMVYDGDREDSPRIGEYCGHKVPPPIVSRGSIMHVMLKNNGIFRATFGLLSEHCGGAFTSASGSFASPGYPTNYDMEMECVWTIEASEGNKVHVTFQDFQLEGSDYCNTDYLEIHEDDPSGRLIGKFCGNTKPSNVTWARKLWIKFRSDDIGTAPGFLAHYELQHGSVVNGTSGFIASPGYPHKFHTEDVYEWTVIAPQGMYISLQFLELAIQNRWGNCYAFVQIYDGMNEEAPDLGQFCGYQLPDPMVSSTNVLTIQFHSRQNYPSQFFVHWAAVSSSGVSVSLDKSSNCSEEYVLNTTGTVNITSPGYSQNYPDNINCTYLIRVPDTHHVVFKILDMNIEGQFPHCQFDRLEAYYAPNTNFDSWFLNRTVCGNGRNIELISPNNMMKLMFATDHYLNYRGFMATARAACGGQLFGDSGVLHSSAVLSNVQDLSHSETVKCEWVITVRQRRTIQITFQSFDIQSGTTCDTSYILLRNGVFSTSPILGRGRYCGPTIPNIPETSSNDVYVEVVYDPASGRIPVFELRYEEVSMGCGGHLFISHDIPSAEISSPNYPSSPTHDIECDWIVISPAGTRLRIDFEEEFHLEPNCYGDDNVEYLDLFDGGTDSAQMIRRYCGHDQPSSAMSTGNTLLVRYVTAVEQPQAGFKATVKIAKCGGTISAYHSIINSPEYPNNYGNSIECEWYLKMKYGYHITLTISDFDTPPSVNCSTTDFLEIRELTPEGLIGDVIRIICGKPDNLPLTIDVPGPAAYMKFKSNSANHAKGFSATMEANWDEGCGGFLEDPTGVITSPRYPNALAARRTCYWRIVAHEGRRVKIKIEELNLPRDETLGECTSYIAVFNATYRWTQSSSVYNYQYCGNNVPEEIDTGSTETHVEFSTTGLSAGQGFKLTYSTEEESFCGGRFTGSSGVIHTPNFAVQNDSFINCRWRIDADVNKTLVLKFSVLDIPGIRANFCRTGKLYFMSPQQYFGALCGNYTNGYTVTSPYPSVRLRLVASLAKPFLGFRGTYNISDCGGVVDGYNAVITSPGYPNNYPPGSNCHWVLKVPEGDVIRLTVVDLQLEEDEHCNNNYLMIRNGLHMESPVLGRFCGTRTVAPIISSGNAVTVYFHSDENGSNKGFNLTTTDVQRGCGGVIHLLSGNFSSPNYPSRYANNVECVWTIEYPPGYLVQIQFEGRFDIEADVNCSSDFLQFEDLENDGRLEHPVVKKCGSQTPEDIISKTNKLRIMFHSNERRNGDGFSLRYSAACGGNFTNQNGYILSPNYPELYSNILLCKYTIGKPGDLIILTFDDYFSIEGQENCIYDYVEIFQRTESDYNSQGLFCGTIPPVQRTLQGPVILKFYTDYYFVAHGFKAHYNILSCGGNFTEPSGIISSPPVTEDYNQDINCVWHIEVETPGLISLRFIDFKINYTYACWQNYISVYDGRNESAPLIQKICSITQDSLIVKSTGNQLTLRFYRSQVSSSLRNSFSAYYYKTYGPAEGCGGTLNATSGEISSVNVAGFYAPNLDCGWTILANVLDQVVKLTFDKFDVEGPSNGSCSDDYVEIRERGAHGPLLGRYCGSTVPRTIISADSLVFVHFHSNDAVNKAGFKISFSVTESPCGTSALLSTTNEQTLSSPNYPSPYPVNLRCKWNIYVNVNISYRRSFVHISIKDMDVPCDGDYLQIKKYDTKRICGPQHTEAINGYSGMEISFYSDQNNNGARGFSLTYRDASCNRNYSDEGGVITNTVYPSHSNAEVGCRINITVAAGKTVSLYFMRFAMASRTECRDYFLKVYDGENENATSLGVYCGYLTPNPIFSTGRSLFIDIKMRNGIGLYHMTYMATDKGRGCGGKVFGAEGAISSPFYPQAYNQTAECLWYITVPGYHTVKLRFNVFDFNSTAGCGSNFVEIYEGATDAVSSRVARYCGQDVPAIYNSQSNQAVVKLVTDSNNKQSGFLLYFESETTVVDPTSTFIQRVMEPGENSIL